VPDHFATNINLCDNVHWPGSPVSLSLHLSRYFAPGDSNAYSSLDYS